MKKTLPKVLIGALIAGSYVANAQTITRDDLKWTIGNIWPSKVNTVALSSIDVSAGTGKSWDFSSYTSGSNDTVKVSASASADVKISSNLQGEVHYKELASNYSLAGIGSFNADDASTGHMGLPHIQGESWTSASTIAVFTTLNIKGTILSAGSITVPWGTYDAVLVKEELTGIMTQTTYFWETIEHGRVATYSEEKGKLMVMQETNFTTGVESISNESKLSVFPNPTNSLITLNGAENGQITIFNSLGTAVKTLVYNGGQTTIDLLNLSKGVYFVQLVNAQGVVTESVVLQ